MNAMQITKQVKTFLRDEQGLTMVEYAVAGGMIAAAGVASFQALGGEVKRVIEGLTTSLTSVP